MYKKQLLAGPKEWELKINKIYLSHLPAQKAEMELTQRDRTLTVPMELEKLHDNHDNHDNQSNFIFANSTIAGKLALFKERDLTFDTNTNSLILARRG